MDTIIDNRGLSFNYIEFINTYGPERYLKMKNFYTIKSHNKMTNTWIRTPMYNIIRTDTTKRICLPRFTLESLMKKGMVTEYSNQLTSGKDINASYTGQSNSNQQKVIDYTMNTLFPEQEHKYGFSGAILNLTAGCHAKDTLIMMHNGLSIPVQDIKSGDYLMGDDSTQRKVLELVKGTSDMYKITNTYGESYIVNGSHILCLLCPQKKIYNNVVYWFDIDSMKIRMSIFDCNELAKCFYYSLDIHTIIEITVDDYLSLPYSSRNQLREYHGIVQYRNRNIIMDAFKFGLAKPWFIPDIYKYNSSKVRIDLLNGLIQLYKIKYDTDTIILSLPGNKELLMLDIIYIIKSLGLIAEFDIDIEYNNLIIFIKGGIHILSGDHNPVDYISTISTIKVEPCGQADYYGFKLDGNKRYMMGNNIITHNSGKTFIGMDLISKINKKTLIVVPNSYLLEQWVTLLKEYFPDNTIGSIYGKSKIDGDIIVSIINTASTLDEYKIKKQIYQFDDILNQVGLVIFDEIHLYVSSAFKKIYNRIHGKITVGLSATPERDDKLHKIAELNVGPIIEEDKIPEYIKNDVKFNSLVKMVRYRCKPEYTSYKIREDGMIDYQSILDQILRDEDRNNLIVDKIVQLIHEHNTNVFVFSERRNHLEHLYELLNDRLSSVQIEDTNVKLEVPEAELSKNIVLYGGASEEQIEEAKNISNVIFTTYAYSSTGVSITKMTGLVLCTPRRRIQPFLQVIGRIFRLSDSDHNAKQRIIYDIIDYKLLIKNGYRSRLECYKTRDSIVEYEDHYAPE